MLDEIYSFPVSLWLGYFKSMFKTCKYVTSCTANRQLSESVSFMRPKGFIDCELCLFSLTLALTQTFTTKGDSLWCYLREKTLVSSRAGHVRIVRSAFAQKTQSSSATVPLSVRRAVTNTGNSSKFLPQCHVAMRSDTGGGCLSVSWELGTYAPAWIIEITFHCSY